MSVTLDNTNEDEETRLHSSEDKQQSVNYLACMDLIWPILKSQQGKLVFAVILATLSVGLELVPVYAIYLMLQQAVEHTLHSHTAFLYLTTALISILGGYLFMGVTMTQSHLIAFETLYQLRLKIANHLARLPLGYFSHKKSGDAKKLLIDDPEKLELIIAHGIPEGISAITTWLAVSIWLFWIDWRMALAAVIITPISFCLLVMGMQRGARYAYPYQSAGQTMNASIVEYLNGLPVVKIFNRSRESYQETGEAIKHYAQIEKQWASAYLPLGGTFFSLVLSNVVFIIILGAILVMNQSLDTLTFVFFVIVGANYSRPLLKLFHLFHELAHISMSSQLATDVLNTPEQPDTKRWTSLRDHKVEFSDVSFKYDNHNVLNNVSFIAEPNQITALVGPSGAGKSTLASLIPRFYDINDGYITIGGVNVKELSLEQLMDTVSFVFQDTFLFSGSIADNIRFGCPDASEESITQAAKAAQIHDMIISLPEGYATTIGDKGRKLSGGERQRIAIARAILKDAPVIILDEATAFTDPENEALIQQAVESLTQGKTVIIIAHRLNTIRDVDQIVVIDDGRVAECGTHTELLNNQGTYLRLWNDFCTLRTDSHQNSLISEGAHHV